MNSGLGEKFLLLQGGLEKKRDSPPTTTPIIKERIKEISWRKSVASFYVSLCQLSVRDLLS